jgi:hypothetical protein
MSDADTVYELTVDVPSSPKGEPIQIPGLGTFENGGTYGVNEDDAQAFRTYHSVQKPVYSEEGQMILGNEVELGPTLLQASKSMFGVEVSSVGTGDKVREKGKSNVVSDTDTSKMVASVPDSEQSLTKDSKKSATEKGGDS